MRDEIKELTEQIAKAIDESTAADISPSSIAAQVYEQHDPEHEAPELMRLAALATFTQIAADLLQVKFEKPMTPEHAEALFRYGVRRGLLGDS